MIILGIETSCDETAAAVLRSDPSINSGQVQILSNIVASSASLQAKYGGIIPEQAAREQIKSIIPVIEESLRVSGYGGQNIDAVAVTYGPGLIGSLLVGVETAKVLAKIWNKPLIPVNHLLGHFYANWIRASSLRDHEARFAKRVAKQSHHNKEIATSLSFDKLRIAPRNDGFIIPSFPCIGLLVSGGHTDLVLFKNHGKYKYLGGTRDDAAGECFDKCARLLGLPYPGGPQISKLAEKGKDTFNLPRPMIDSDDFDFSFSGLKTAVASLVKNKEVARGGGERGAPLSAHSEARTSNGAASRQDPEPIINNLSASVEAAIVDVLVTKTIKAAQKYRVEQIIVAGGVAANQKLVGNLKFKIKNLKLKVKLFVPPPSLCTDNAAMIAAAAFFSPRSLREASFAPSASLRAGEAGQKPIKNSLSLQADPNLSLV